MKQLILILFVLFSLVTSAQDINQFDNSGERHGIWKKNFENTQQVRYEGQFENGKETGLFKYYQLIGKNSMLAATKYFEDDGSAIVKFLSIAGKTISEGKMVGKLYVGQWTYYHKNSDAVMTIEHYTEQGHLHGQRIVYYVTQQKAEEVNYVDGKREGEEKHYALDGNLAKVYNYENDELHGEAKHFDGNNNLVIEGKYKRHKKVGVWKYYVNGKLVKEKNWDYKPKRSKKQ